MPGSDQLFANGARVSISPDDMRAWVILPPPPAGMAYTAAALAAWLPTQGVVFGVQPAMLAAAAASRKYDELLEVARGEYPVEPQGAGYKLLIDPKPFTGLNGNADGSLFYDDFSFLQEARPGDVLAELTPPVPGRAGTDVRGHTVPPRKSEAEDDELPGTGFTVSADGAKLLAPVLSHVGMANGQLVVTPLKKRGSVGPEDGIVEVDGNLFVEGNVTAGSTIKATGSVFVTGKCETADIEAGRNVLLAGGMRSGGGFGEVNAGGSVWGACFEHCTINAGGDICANYLRGCEATAGGRSLILGGSAQVAASSLYAKNGIVAGTLGFAPNDGTLVQAGIRADVFAQQDTLSRNIQRIAVDIEALNKNISAFERIHKFHPEKLQNNPAYTAMLEKRVQAVGSLAELNEENKRTKRMIDQGAFTAIIARERVFAGVEVMIDMRSLAVPRDLPRTKFRRAGQMIETLAEKQG